ncbi:MAG: LPS-assembly protein LptD [Burkholderiales bacterium]|mgnify:CR=1 FL=1|jgi:LPS-assembly protein|uniref:LPS-assembly protein LptD n=1 Tax=Candidatus Aalborgicola defluviihabitans TaxID=3386187 RepID=UPI001DB622F0|nr:LPS-assembly protein LptD [Burkholderiales bacterium]MBK6570317.1 LPS-assembly protein LptD [Burkholderiales bacterium]MBL0243795.1 LPS-assembly protein LptD [Rhodoferax sp.]
MPVTQPDLSVRRPALRCLLPGMAVLAALAVSGVSVHAQETDAGLTLKSTGLLDEQLPSTQGDKLPVFVVGDRLKGRPDLDTVIEGNVELRKAGTVIRADRIEYSQPTDQVIASGNVHINRKGDVFEGPLLDLKVDAFEGFFTAPSYHFLKSDGHGEAEKAEFLDESHTIIHNATYTTCQRKPGPDWLPDWILRASRIELDNDEDVGIAHDAVVSFKGVPILPIPALSFPLTDKRKSGLLPPTIGVGTDNGVEVALPYYWNIAPNRDATFTPKLMTHRGIDLGGEFRYLEPAYSGIVRGNFTPGDRLTDTDRWGLSFSHQGTVPTELGGVLVGANVNRVSDDTYWRDFPSNSVSNSALGTATAATTAAGAAITQRLLPTDLIAAWGLGAFFGTARVLKWQTLQDVTAPIIPPYDRAPQLTGRYALTNVRGFDWSFDGDFTQFEADRSLTLQPNARRGMGLLQISRPWLAPEGFITPKLQWHATSYQFDAALADGSRAADSVVPTFSLDSGLVFERDTRLFGHNLIQTLEPRAFYVYTPYRNQGLLPNYDTAANDFNFATIYTENAFVGHDKISDNNLLTLGVSTRFLDAESGAQLASFGVAQRLRFEDQRVALNAATPAAQAGFSDVLLGASVNVQDSWALDTTVQYNAKTDRSIRSTFGVRYTPGHYQVINAAYRFQRDSSEQMDVSWQWPLNNLWGDTGTDLGAGRGQGPGRYYGVGRLNYSFDERRLVDTILGVEYDAGCWLARVVLERVQTSTSTATGRLMFQLELVGLTRLGVSPLQSLTQNISRYQNLRESGGSSSRFSNYD